jgi:hypothetical protein
MWYDYNRLRLLPKETTIRNSPSVYYVLQTHLQENYINDQLKTRCENYLHRLVRNIIKLMSMPIFLTTDSPTDNLTSQR